MVPNYHPVKLPYQSLLWNNDERQNKQVTAMERGHHPMMTTMCEISIENSE
jgi:hypothetical protein